MFETGFKYHKLNKGRIINISFYRLFSKFRKSIFSYGDFHEKRINQSDKN